MLHSLISVAVGTLVALPAQAAGTAVRGRADVSPPGVAATPPMGWNGYPHFGPGMSAAQIEAGAHALVTSGMAAAGYRYVVVDGGWASLHRDAAGSLVPSPARYPAGIQPVIDYVHSLGLTFGLYTSAGMANCAATSAGSYGHEKRDAAQFAAWGIDFLKLDWCYVPYSDFPGWTSEQVAQRLAWRMSSALGATGRPVVLDVNDAVGSRLHDFDWQWAPVLASEWRIASDIRPTYAEMVARIFGIGLPWPRPYDLRLWSYAGPNSWNDPDILEVGNAGMSTTLSRTEFSLWAEEAAPLMAGNDLTTMTAATRAILTNAGVIAVDQDPLGRQGHPVSARSGHWVIAKPLAGRSVAVVLFNATHSAATITTTASAVGLPSAARYRLRNLWSRTTRRSTGKISAEVPSHRLVMLRASV